MKKIVAGVLAAVGIFTLSACGVSDEEAAACTASGGTVVERSYPVRNASWYERDETHDFTLCEDGSGKILKVYEHGNQRKGDPDNTFLSNEGNWVIACKREGGEAWTTKVGKSSRSFICVVNGKVVRAK